MNFWAIFSLVAGVSNLFLGFYILYKSPKSSLNKVFTLFAFSLAIWGIAEFKHRNAITPGSAHFWIGIGGLGWCFMPSLSLHFILIFAKQKKYLKNLLYILLYAPSTVFLSLFLTTDLIYNQEVVTRYWGYTSLPGNLIWTFMLYYMLLYIVEMYFLIGVAREGTTLEKKQAKPIIWGNTLYTAIATVLTIYNDIGNDIGILLPPMGATFSIAWAICIVYAVLKHKLFVIEPYAEGFITTSQKYLLEEGFSYFVKEERSDKSYGIFYDQVTHGSSGLCVTKLAPWTVRERYNLVKTPILCLTFKEIDNAISPKDTDVLTSVVSDFVRGTEKSLLFLDCFDQIKFATGFEKSLSVLKDFKNLCHENGSIMLMSISPKMFNQQQVADIEQELEEIKTE